MDGLTRKLRAVAQAIANPGSRRPVRMYRPVWGVERFEERMLLSIALISSNSAGTGSGSGASLIGDPGASPQASLPAGQTSPTLSADGTLMVFQSDATDLVASSTDTNQATDVFLRNLQSGQTALVSTTPGGAAGNGRSFDPVISPDGRYVAFLSTATNLSSVAANAPDPAAGDGTGLLYVRDLKTGTTTLVDATPDGQPSNGLAVSNFAFSPDGTKLAFSDSSTNLTATPPGAAATSGGPATDNVYVRDLSAGTTTAVSMTPGGTLSQGSLASSTATTPLVFSPDGKTLVFASAATDLTATAAAAGGSGGSVVSLYAANLAAGTTSLVSGTTGGQIANGSASRPVFSPDGSTLAFLSTATNLTSASPGGANGSNSNLFIHDMTAGTTTAVSTTPAQALSAGTVNEMVFSPDSKSLAFVSTATDLTSNAAATPLTVINPSGPNLPQWPASNVFVRNLAAGSTTAVSLTADGKLSNGFAGNLSYTPDGQSLAYLSSAFDLTANPTPPVNDTAPAASKGSLPLAPASPPANLFLTNLATPATTLVSVTPAGTLSSGNVTSYTISPDGTKIAFDAVATDLTNNPPTVSAAPATVQATSAVSDNVFVRDLAAATTTLLSAMPDGTLSSDPAFNGSAPLYFSRDSHTVYFGTGAALVGSDTNQTSDIYAATTPFATPGAIRFTSWTYSANEASGQAVVTVVRNGPFDAPATVDYSLQDGSAQAGTDYQATSGTLSFASGQAAASFVVGLNTADAFANTRSATITLSNPSGAPLGFPTATLSLTGVLPVVPVTITTTGTPRHPHTRPHTKTPTPTPTASPTSTTTGSTAGASSSAAGQGAGSVVYTVYTATTPTPTPTPTSTPTPTPTSTPTPTPTSTSTPTPTSTSSTGSGTGSSTSSSGSTTTSTSGGSGTSTNTNSGSTGTSTSTPTSTVAAATATPGPIVASIALRATRQKIGAVIIKFNEPLATASAGNLASYGVNLLSLSRPTKHSSRQTTVGRPVRVSSATYDAGSQSVTLTLGTPLGSNQRFHLRVSGGPGGITDQAGNALNSPSAGAAGSDFVYNLG